MQKTIVLLIGSLVVLAGLSACEFVSVQLADKAREEQLLKPGALDPAIPTMPYYVKHTFKFLEKYQITHEWHNLGRSCGYGGYLGKPEGVELRVFDSKGEIYEEGGKTYYMADKNYAGINKKTGDYWRSDFDRFVRPTYKRQIPEFDAAGNKTGNMMEKEETGLEPVCFEAWVGTSHSTALRLYKSSLAERIAFYSKRPGKRSQETIGAQTWWAWRYPIDNGSPEAYGGEAWVRAIGDTGYTLALELGAGHESLKFPQAHANFQAMFRHLIESVKIEETELLNADHPDNLPSRKPVP